MYSNVGNNKCLGLHFHVFQNANQQYDVTANAWNLNLSRYYLKIQLAETIKVAFCWLSLWSYFPDFHSFVLGFTIKQSEKFMYIILFEFQIYTCHLNVTHAVLKLLSIKYDIQFIRHYKRFVVWNTLVSQFSNLFNSWFTTALHIFLYINYLGISGRASPCLGLVFSLLALLPEQERLHSWCVLVYYLPCLVWIWAFCLLVCLEKFCWGWKVLNHINYWGVLQQEMFVLFQW